MRSTLHLSLHMVDDCLSWGPLITHSGYSGEGLNGFLQCKFPDYWHCAIIMHPVDFAAISLPWKTYPFFRTDILTARSTCDNMLASWCMRYAARFVADHTKTSEKEATLRQIEFNYKHNQIIVPLHDDIRWVQVTRNFHGHTWRRFILLQNRRLEAFIGLKNRQPERIRLFKEITLLGSRKTVTLSDPSWRTFRRCFSDANIELPREVPTIYWWSRIKINGKSGHTVCKTICLTWIFLYIRCTIFESKMESQSGTQDVDSRSCRYTYFNLWQTRSRHRYCWQQRDCWSNVVWSVVVVSFVNIRRRCPVRKRWTSKQYYAPQPPHQGSHCCEAAERALNYIHQRSQFLPQRR